MHNVQGHGAGYTRDRLRALYKRQGADERIAAAQAKRDRKNAKRAVEAARAKS